MFYPNGILYEEGIENYELGRKLLLKYKDVPKALIENHNNIEEMRKNPNSEFANMKKNLIIATPYTSSGCTAMCMYCYLVCNYNKCAYLRLFVNREYMLDKIKKTALKADRNLTFEIGSNSDLILENTITDNLVWTIENFADSPKGLLTFPTKFHMVDPILNIKGKEKVIVRMSVNPAEIINRVEFGTSMLNARIDAINKLHAAGYKVGILVAPVILVENWKSLYEELLIQLSQLLSPAVKKDVFFEVIFMTYSYVHRAINAEAFPNAIDLFDTNIMTGRGKGKYMYKPLVKEHAGLLIRHWLEQYFPGCKILYVV